MDMSKIQKNKPLVIGVIVAVLVLLIHWLLVTLNVYSLDLSMTGAAEISVEYGSVFEDPGAAASYFGTLFQRNPIAVEVTAVGTVDTSKLGEYTIEYYAEYEGVTERQSRIIRVVDTRKPELTLSGDATVILPVGAEYEEAGYTAADNHSGDLTAGVEVFGQVDPAVPGNYTLTYTVRDRSGNETSVRRTVIYEDVTAPEIVLSAGAEVVIAYGSVFEEPGFSAADDCDGDLTAAVTVSGTVDTGVTGTYSLVYTVTDRAGNAALTERLVTVTDSVSPEVFLSGESTVTIFIGEVFEEPGYTATDNYDGNLTQLVEISGNVNNRRPGTYTLTYTVTDSSGNAAAAERTVIVCRGIVYLTYDDGPSRYTSRLLDLLDAYGVKATFFVVNTGYLELITRAAEEGHTVAIHSATHDYDQIYASEEAFFEDLYYMQSLIQSYTGQTPMMTRFPGGSSNTCSWFNKGIMTRLTALVEEKGFRYFDWNVCSMDAGGVTEGWTEVASNVIRGITCQRESVVLMHDSYGTCLRATERILDWGLANGYIFLPLDYDSPGCHQPINN